MSGVCPSKLRSGRRKYGPLTRRRSFHRITTSAVIWEILGRLGPYCVALALLFTPFAPSVREIQAQALPAQTTPSNHAKQPEGNEAPAVPPARADQTIPLPQIADRAEQLDRLTKEIYDQLTPKSELREAERKTEAQAAETSRRALQTRDRTYSTFPVAL